MKRKIGDKLISIITIMIIFIIWYLASNFGNFSEVIIPSPQKVFNAFIEIVKNGYKGHTLLQHFASSMIRLLIAYFLVIVTIIPIGLLSGYSHKIRAILEPIIEFSRPLPPLAYYTLLVLWFGIGDLSKIILLYLAGAAPVYISCVAGVKRIREDYTNGALTLGASKPQVFFYVILPAALPDIFTGLRTAIGVEYTTLVAAEMVAAVAGIGWLVLDASKYLRSDIIFFGIILMGLTGMLLNFIIKTIENKVVHWKGKN